MAMQVERPSIDGELLDRLLAGCDPKTILESDGLIGDLKKALAERMLDAEMDVHLGREEEQAAGTTAMDTAGRRCSRRMARDAIDPARPAGGRFGMTTGGAKASLAPYLSLMYLMNSMNRT